MGTNPDFTPWLESREAFLEALASGSTERYRRRRWQRRDEFMTWLDEGSLPSLSPEQSVLLYRASGGNRVNDFKSNPVEEIRDSLDFLLYDTIKLEGRFDECAAEGGAYKLAGAGKEFVSYVLCLRDPNLFASWNAHGEKALRTLGAYPDSLRRGLIGMRYIDLLDAMHRMRARLGLGDFRAVDEFCYFLSRRPRNAGRG